MLDDPSLKLSEILAALSTVLDRVEGQPEGHTIRSCLIGMTIAERLALTEDERSALFYALLLKDAGCSSNAARVTMLFDADDFTAKRNMKTVNWSNILHAGWYAARNVSPGGTAWAKARHLFGLGRTGTGAARQLVQIRCDRGAEISRFLGFPDATAEAIYSLDEHWDGAGYPDGLRGDQIPLLARICNLAQTVEVFARTYGPVETRAMVLARRKRWFDPALADLFLAEARSDLIWESLSSANLSGAIVAMEPRDRVIVATTVRLDRVARAFAQIIDAKSPYTFEHSARVAAVAAAITEHLGLGAAVAHDQMRAGLLHDIGKLGVPNRILDKPGKLTDEEYDEIRKHPELTYQVLMRVPPFRGIAEIAAAHHERLDGTGYYRGLKGSELSTPARILAVADVYDALSSARPYREALPREQVLAILDRDRAIGLCAESVDAVVALAMAGRLDG